MTAKEMFEKLGYQQFIGDKEHYSIGEFIQYNNYEHSRWIRFDFYDKTINCSMYDEPVEAMDITINELKAINKQVEELGWNNE